MAACLGGWSYGASSLEMASAYATLANDGVFHEPTAVMRITDSKGRTIVDNGSSGVQIYDKNAARMVSKMLQYGVEQGIATGAQLDDAVVAVKTGTTTDNKDGWTAGYSAYYTTAVWVGYDIPKRMENLTGGTYPMTIWKSFMQEIHEGLKLKEFPEYTRFKDGTSKADGLSDNIIDNSVNNEQESTAALEDIQNALGDKNYNGAGGDGNASGLMGGDTGAGSIGGDGNSSGTAGGDRSAGSLGGDGNASGVYGGDSNTSITGKGDGSASGMSGDRNAGSLGGDSNASGFTGGDQNAGSLGGDGNASGMNGGDSNASVGGRGDANAVGGQSGDTNAGRVTGGDSDVILP